MSDPVWYRKKRYAHFDVPLSADHATAYVSNPERVAKRSFYPFLAFDIKVRRYKSKKGVAEIKSKKRPIRMASHVDGYIFSYYAWMLSKRYESFIEDTPLQNCVLAYRSGIGSNITFAKDAFSEVDRRGACVAIAMDLEKFFDSLDHEHLKRQWCQVIGMDRLPPDHYAVFKAMTRYARVDREAAYAALGIKDVPPKPLCTPSEFRTKIRAGRLIQVNADDFGIPQGSPMSSVLSNIYMIPFDQEMVALAHGLHGYYRRYCDDILWIIEDGDQDTVQRAVEIALTRIGSKIAVNQEKTIISRFDFKGLSAGEKPLQYLGFTYDGYKRLIRSQTLSKFWRKVVYGVRAAKGRANKSAKAGASGDVFKRKLYRRFTHLGRNNFISYAKRSFKTMEDEAIRSQVKDHWQRIQEELGKPLK
ncbi:antiviral reverse transcriptase Drt2 [Azospirillum sp. 11R-A]|uniref:antiviral reverse transcriptase Drt2 n=1 Tax=Azospirillum sp. 11R-A TaxID=3111634 RepID=UPI003C1BD447